MSSYGLFPLERDKISMHGCKVSSRRLLCIFRSRLIIKALGYSSKTPYDQTRSGVNFNVGDTCIHEIDVKIVKLRSVIIIIYRLIPTFKTNWCYSPFSVKFLNVPNRIPDSEYAPGT